MQLTLFPDLAPASSTLPVLGSDPATALVPDVSISFAAQAAGGRAERLYQRRIDEDLDHQR